MDANEDVPGDSGDRVSSRSGMPSKRLDQGVLFEKRCRLKNERSGYLSANSARRNETSLVRCQEQFSFDSLQADDFCQRVQEWIRKAEEMLCLNSQINPED